MFLPNTVFEPGVVCTGIHKINKSHLPDISQSLEFRCVDYFHRNGTDFNVPMNGVLNVFGIFVVLENIFKKRKEDDT